MTGMTDQETSSYVSHHLTLAGRSDTLFSDEALALIHPVSRGLLNCELRIETPPAKRVAAAFAILADAI
jgi:type II secretory pathway predicted ATPase ExeA